MLEITNAPYVNMTHDLATSLNLLGRLKHSAANRDWEDFYDRYSPVILSFAQKCGMDFQGAEDVLQETVICLMQKLPGFEYDPQKGKFRSWLRQIVKYKTLEQLRRAGAPKVQPLSASALDLEIEHKTPLHDAPDLGRGIDAAWELSVLEQALRQIRNDPTVKKETCDIFFALVVEEQPIADIEARFGVKRNAIYQIKNRMQKRLREEIALLAGSPN
jgi:RNA polymerase sigma factor (sigma-70 family)